MSIEANRQCCWSLMKIVLWSRFQITLLSVVSDQFLPDHQADAFINDHLSDYFDVSRSDISILDRLILTATRPFTRWDAQYFLTIATDGAYSKESFVVFFPGYPFLLRLISLILNHCLNLLHIELCLVSVICLVAYLVNLVCFILSSYALFRLTFLVFHNQDLAKKTVKLFAYNPASIFFTAFYSESFFLTCTLFALINLYERRSLIFASILFAIAVLIRSNGLVSVGYLVFWQLIQLINAINYQRPIKAVKVLGQTVFAIAIVLIPFLCFQFYIYQSMCGDQNFDSTLEWCNSTIPLSYQAVQSKYWNVGFFRYYQWKQIPNFLLATPIIITILYSSWIFSKEFIQCIDLKNFKLNTWLKFIDVRFSNLHSNRMFLCLPFMIHSLFLAMLCLTVMNVQVATRFLISSNPWPLWALIEIFQKNQSLGKWTTLLIKVWFYGYFIIGSVMFANFLPFT